MIKHRSVLHNAKYQPLSDEGLKTLHRLYMAGHGMPDIAKIMQLTKNQVKNYIARFQKKDPVQWPLRKPGKKIVKEQPQTPQIYHPIAYACSEVTTYHISELPQAEQDRLMNLVDPDRNTKPAFGGGWGMLP